MWDNGFNTKGVTTVEQLNRSLSQIMGLPEEQFNKLLAKSEAQQLEKKLKAE